LSEGVNVKQCSQCKGTHIIIDREAGEEICGNCGFVLNETQISMSPEWRSFSMQEKQTRSRTGLGTSFVMYDKGLSTVLTGFRDGTGKKLNEETMRTMSRLRRYDNRSKIQETWRRNLSIAMAELDRMGDALHIPNNIKERSAIMYRKALKKDFIRGRSIDAFVAACIYAVCRQSGLPRQLKEISELSKREHSEVARSYRFLIREMGLRMPVDDPFKFIPKMASRLGLRVETEHRAIEILRSVKDLHGLSGKDPKGVAAAALYKACLEKNDKRVQKQVAMAAGTTEVTLRNRLRGFETLFAHTPVLADD
jgi:transcription initiation factor TFIIB